MTNQRHQNHQQHERPVDPANPAVFSEAEERERAPFFDRPVAPVEPRPGGGGRAVYEAMHRAGGPLRTMAEVYLLWEEMLRAPRQSVWLAIAGAYIPFGLGGTMRALLHHRFIDVLVTTPAQLTHDLTEARGLRHFQGREEVDDAQLQRLDVNRYWNVFGDEHDLNTNEDVIFDFAATLTTDRPYTPSEYFWRLGRWLDRSQHKGADSMLTVAAQEGVPIFCPSPADADMVGDLAHYRKRTGRRILIDPLREALDMVALNAAAEDAGGRAGFITMGGGAPRNYGQQAMACAYMLDRRDLKKYNYGLRISLDPVQTGGLSGSTISEAVTWKKYSPDVKAAEYFGEYMVPLVQMTQALVDTFASAPPRERVTVAYGDDGRMLVTVQGSEVDVQSAYGYS